jgi:hypothetical protein
MTDPADGAGAGTDAPAEGGSADAAARLGDALHGVEGTERERSESSPTGWVTRTARGSTG